MLPRSQSPQEARPGRIGSPRAGLRHGHRLEGRRLPGQGFLRRRVPRGDRQPQHVTEGAGVLGRHRLTQLEQGRGEHRLVAHDASHRREPAGVLCRVAALEDEPVDVLARESHLDPHPRPQQILQGGRHGVVERPVQVRQRHVDGDPHDRILCRELRRGRQGARRLAHRHPGEQRELPRLAAAAVRLVHALVLSHDTDKAATPHPAAAARAAVTCSFWLGPRAPSASTLSED